MSKHPSPAPRQRTPEPMRRAVMLAPVRFLPVWVVLLLWPVLTIVTTSRWGGLISAAGCGLSWMVIDVAFGFPRAVGLPTWWRWLSLAALTVAVISRISQAPSWRVEPSDAIGPLLLVVLLLAWVYDRRAGIRRPSPALRWPLPSGRWLVVEGTGRLFNHHWGAPRQRAALDIVGLSLAGRSFRGRSPDHFDQFIIAGDTVVAPIGGRIIQSVDDAPMWPTPGVAATGNHVIIDAGTCRVLIAHLVPGSLRVSVGDTVTVGEQIGAVGTSGNSTQPHLHIHAIDDHGPLRLTFDGIRSTGHRGSIIRTRSSAEPDPPGRPRPLARPRPAQKQGT